jgi:hypothetical protein
VKILITSPDTFEVCLTGQGSNLTVGAYYNVEPACEGTAAQNKTLHKLIAVYFRSGLYSYPAKNEGQLKDQIKLHIGQGVDYYVYGVSQRQPCSDLGRTADTGISVGG